MFATTRFSNQELFVNVRSALGLACLVAGLALLYFGFNESNSLASDVSEVVSGSPTDRSMWLMIGGGALAVFGGFMAVTGGKSS
jgi:hypothetical protein